MLLYHVAEVSTEVSILFSCCPSCLATQSMPLKLRLAFQLSNDFPTFTSAFGFLCRQVSTFFIHIFHIEQENTTFALLVKF